VAAGLEFQPGDNVIHYFDDYPSNVYPWMRLAEQGVEVRRVEPAALGWITLEDVLRVVDERTRFVSLASCHFIAGIRLNVDKIGRALRERGILFCVDGIQTLGAFETCVEHVDFLAADAHKWMLGPCSAGVLYVRREVQERLKPVMVGWHNVLCPDFVARDEMVFRRGAARYEAGTHNLMGLVGMNAALELLLEVGIANIAAELLRKRQVLISGLRGRSCEVLYGDAPDSCASGIVSFQRRGEDMTALHARLKEQRILTSLRMDRQGRAFIRLSPHFYTSDAELARLLDAL
jgi:selenocysteine lyase/cysteine desulfurase